jgi:hypothetical protein
MKFYIGAGGVVWYFGAGVGGMCDGVAWWCVWSDLGVSEMKMEKKVFENVVELVAVNLLFMVGVLQPVMKIIKFNRPHFFSTIKSGGTF